MILEDSDRAWEPVDTIQVAVEDVQWVVAFALTVHQSAYYRQVRTYKEDAPDEARVRLVGPYPDRLAALAAVQDLVSEATRTMAGATQLGAPDSALASES